MSLRYNLFKRKLANAGAKAKTALPANELLETAREFNSENPFTLPDDNMSWKYSDRMFDDSHCLVMRNKHTDASHALLYVYGDWMLRAPSKQFTVCAQNLGVASRRDVWMPHYPLCTDHSILDAVKMILDVYDAMLDEYSPQNIDFYGFGSGATLLMSMLAFSKSSGTQLPSPRKLVAISPATCASNDHELVKMRRVDPFDVRVDIALFSNLRKIWQHGSDVPEYMLSGKEMDCKGFPETWIYFGTEECLSVKSDMYESLLKRGKVDFQINLARGMCHCYCVDLEFPEAKQDYEEVLQLLNWE